MSRSITLCLCLLIICTTQSGSFKIISKIKNYLLPTTTTTTAVPILPDFEKNGTQQEIPWGEEATEESVVTTTARHTEDKDDQKSYAPNPTSTLQTSSIQDGDYMPTKNKTLFPPPKGQSLYPTMPTPTTAQTAISDNGQSPYIPEAPFGQEGQESTTPELVNTSYTQQQDFTTSQNSTQGISDNGLEGSKTTKNQSRNVADSSGHANGGDSYDINLNPQHGDGDDLVGLFGNLTSNQVTGGNCKSGYGSGNPAQNVGTAGNNGGISGEKPNPNGSQKDLENGGNSKNVNLNGNQQQPGGTNGTGNVYGETTTIGNQNSGHSGGASNGENVYGKPTSIGNPELQDNNENIHGGNELGQAIPNKKHTQNNNNNDDGFIFPDHPSLNPLPELEVGGGGRMTTHTPDKPVPVEDGRRVIDAPVKDCGKGRKLNANGECKKQARK